MSTLITHIKRLALALCLATPFVSWAAYPTSDIISLNISNDQSYRMIGDGETDTLAGLLPDNAWKNTSQGDRTGVLHTGDARNGYSNGVTAWDGTNQQVVTLGDVVFTWAVEGDGTTNYGNVDAPNNPVFHKAWLARANAAAETSSILLQNIPYEKYDVIVYCFGSDDVAFNPVSVNGVYYVGDNTLETETKTRLATSSSETWGGRRATPSLGQTAIRVNGVMSPELLISIRSGVTSICAVQIVRDMSFVGEETLAAGKVISVNLQSSHNTNGYKPESYGLVRVPATAWTDDGLSSASAGGADVAAEIREWNGYTKTSYALSGITINEKANNAYSAYKAWNAYGEYIPIANLINAYLDDGGDRALVTVTGVPYKQYDVIVYTATDSKGRYFGPVTVNGTPYRWSNGETVVSGSADSTADTRWGYSLCPVPAYGVNALRITGQTSSTLTIKGANNANTARGGIAGFQIVDTYIPPAMNVEPDGTIVISEPVAEEKSVVCDGSFTIIGTETYTVTASDLRKFDFSGVTGTVMLGAYTTYPLGSNRSLPAGFAFGEGSTVEINETRAEFLADSFTVSGLTGVSRVKLTRADGTIESIDVSDGVATFGSGNGTTKIDGVATMYDLTFANNEADVGKVGYHTNQGTFTYTCGAGELNYDRAATFNNDAWDDTTGLYLRCSPYIDLAASAFNALGDFTTVVVGQMSPSQNTIFLHLGSCNGGNGLLIATTENPNEVIIAKNSSRTVDVANSVKAKVPNAATARHAYAIVKRGSTFAVWVDGVRRGIIDVGDNFRLGTSSHAGLQVGSHFGGDGLGTTWKKVANSETETGVVNVIRVFDYAISDAQAEAVFAAYPYESEGGLYKRTVDGDASFSAEGAWSDSDENTYDAPVSATEGYNPSATITVESASKLTVNAAVILDKLTIGGTAALTLDGTNAITVADSAIINSPLVVRYGALDLAGTPVQLGSAGSITFDCSAIDVSSIYKTTHYQLTGLVDRDDSKVIVTEPAGDAYRTVATVYNENGFYELVVTPDHEAGSDVYYAGGYVGTTENTFSVTNASGRATIVFPGDSLVVPAYHNGSSAYFGSTLPDNISAIRVEKDFSFEPGVSEPILSGVTVAVSEGKKLTFGATWHGLDLGAVTLNGPGVVEFDGSKAGNANDEAAGTFKVSGAVAGTSTLTIAAGKAVTVESTGSIANAIVLKAGASLTVDANASVTEPTTDVEGYSVKPTDNGESTVYSVVENCSIDVILDQGVAEPNGTVTIKVGETNLESGDTVPDGTTVTVAVTPAEGFKINEVEVTMGGLDITERIETEETGNVTTATLEINDDTTIAITFALKAVSFTVEAVANTTVKVMEGASEVTPENGVYSVNAGAQVKVIWEAADGYIVTGGETAWFTPSANQVVATPTGMVINEVAARVFDTTYATLKDAVDAATAYGAEVVLLKDVTLTECIEPNPGGSSMTINLNGHKITREGTGGNGSAFDVKSGTVTIKNGTIDCTQDDTAIAKDGVYAITARAGSTVTLEGLNVTVNSECGACVYPFANNMGVNVQVARVYIKSGTYLNTTTTPYRYRPEWTGMSLNQANKTSSSAVNTGGIATQMIFVSGGTFGKVDPELGDDTWTEGEGTFIDGTAPASYIAVPNGDGTYTVREGTWVAKVGGTKFESFDAAVAAAKVSGEQVMLLKDHPTGMAAPLVVSEPVTVNANGHLISTPTVTVAGGYIIAPEQSFLGADTWIVETISGEAPNRIVKYGYGATRTVKMEYLSGYGNVVVTTGDLVRRVPDYDAAAMGGPSGVYFYVKDGAEVKFTVTPYGDRRVKSATIKVGDGEATSVDAPVEGVYTVAVTGGDAVISVEFEDIPATTPAEPGDISEPVDSQAEAETDAAKTEVSVPDAVAQKLSEEQKTAYTEMFEPKVIEVKDGEATKYAVEVALKADVVTEIQTDVDAEAEDLASAAVAAAADATNGGEATVTTKPGLYYVVEAGTELNGIEPASCTLATSTETKLTVPNKGTKGFYKIRVSVTPVQVQE